MSEDYIIRHGAPTLAGIKTGNIFPCPYESKAALIRAVRQMNKRLRPKGLRILPLRYTDGKALIYLYRPKKLSVDLSDRQAVSLLRQYGYDPEKCDQCIARLAQKLRSQADFPHEIGLFIGYPPEDVSGFIENRAGGCKCVGCWKVYGDEQAAKKKFAQYKKCTKIYCDQWSKGRAIERLAVAS